jgi:putative cardiolipin synthase
MSPVPRNRWLVLCLSLLVLFSHGCATLPPRPDVAFEAALPPPTHGAIPDISEDFRRLRGSEASGFSLLIDAQEAFEARLALVDQAVSSIDIQSFIWSGDATGTLLFSRLLEAADRGVKVRIIVDDIWLGTTTKDLAALNVHPNLEVRLFNPNPMRDGTVGAMLQFLASFQELNRRMHNKLMIVDNLALIGGGRNIGDPYFGLSKKYNFIDIDVLAFGAVIVEASSAFDTYWNHTAVYPIRGWSDILPSNTMDEVRQAVLEALDSYLPLLSSYPIDHRDWSHWSDELARTLLPGEAHFLQDDPVHIDGKSYRLVT